MAHLSLYASRGVQWLEKRTASSVKTTATVVTTVVLVISHALPPTWAIVLILALFVAAYALWVVASRRQKAARQELDAASLEVWHEGICPVCLALYTANQLNTETIQLKV